MQRLIDKVKDSFHKRFAFAQTSQTWNHRKIFEVTSEVNI